MTGVGELEFVDKIDCNDLEDGEKKGERIAFATTQNLTDGNFFVKSDGIKWVLKEILCNFTING